MKLANTWARREPLIPREKPSSCESRGVWPRRRRDVSHGGEVFCDGMGRVSVLKRSLLGSE